MADRIKSRKSSGNVFADLRMDQPEQRFLKATLVVRLLELLDKLELTQIQAAAQLGVRQPDISRLRSGDLSHYSVERLLGFFNSLNQRVEIRITPARGRKGAETVISL